MHDRQVLIEAWKQSVAVQMHFNDLAMRIRAFALTLIAALITAQSLTQVQIVWLPTAAALGCWIAFYFMDRWWYHYLLLGAVLHAQQIEEAAGNLGVAGLDPAARPLALTGRVATLNREGFPFAAKYKVDLYYLVIGSAVFMLLPARGQISFRMAAAPIVLLFLFWIFMAVRGARKSPPKG